MIRFGGNATAERGGGGGVEGGGRWDDDEGRPGGGGKRVAAFSLSLCVFSLSPASYALSCTRDQARLSRSVAMKGGFGGRGCQPRSGGVTDRLGLGYEFGIDWW
ncbi:hypothetical protein ONS95_005071 [Cadophora gregata]|uniref:uncharacterized protein n=1 Tax=Cadophora gregata TaxID=51156 RepID=UPI0026DC9E84|nr:uncharacterized protein ONS95_005071 [Cadophora gregata]KAK0104803.1 hypothetical protein ONS95_005071 [Cadophora gregata]